MFPLPTTTAAAAAAAAAAWVRPIAVRAHAGVLLLPRYVRARGRALIRLLVVERAWLLPPAIYWLVYLALSQSWTAHYGVSAWAPAWPVARTRFVLTLCAAPITASILLVLVLLFTLAHHAQDRAGHMYHDYELFGADSKILVDPDHSSGSAQHRTVRMTLWPRVITVFYAIVVALGAYAAATWEQPLDHVYKADVIKAVAFPRPSGYCDGEKVFIAAMFYNNAHVLPHWSDEIVKLIHYLGTANVYVSIVESNSGDRTPELLRAFDARLHSLGVARRVLVGDNSIPRPADMSTAQPRIEFLAAVRNLVLAPLVTHGGYERVLFSNDVFLTAESAVELLRTNGGAYDMACALDFHSWGLYDAWVIRDRLGGLVSSLWPYLLEETSMLAVMEDAPARVSACWNGLAAIRADPLLPPALRSPVYAASVHGNASALAFRALRSDECFSSECFLLPYDLAHARGRGSQSLDAPGADVFVNPRVIVGYEWKQSVWWKYVTRHWAVRWWIMRMERGAEMPFARMIVGPHHHVWRWAGGDCFPWW